MKDRKKIGLLIIATNKYIIFLNKLLASANKHFCLEHDVTYFIFSNRKMKLNLERSYKIFHIEHKEWPWMTLGRYHIFKNAAKELSEMDYLFYTDADMEFVGDIGSEILGDRVATNHPIYDRRRGVPETNPESLAYVREDEPITYFAGGFNGGTSTEYLKMCHRLSTNIDKDYSKGIIAVWHDESHMNRYFIDEKPTVVLDTRYCYPEEWVTNKSDKKIIALSKNHKEIRS